MVLKVALRSSGNKLTPYVQDFKTDGKRQREFAEKYGNPNGQCVAKKVSEGMTQEEIHEAVTQCAK